MYLGAPAFAAAGTTAYAAIGNADGMQAIAHNVEKMGLSNFGGVMVRLFLILTCHFFLLEPRAWSCLESC